MVVVTSTTGAQSLRVTASDSATPFTIQKTNLSWLQLSTSTGTGAALITMSLGAVPAPGAYVGHLSVSSPEVFATALIEIRLDVFADGTTAGPFGSFDSPATNVSGITGSLSLGGWALDDIQATRVAITRDPFGSETPGVPIFIGDAVFVEGARPDVQTLHPTRPFASRAGWGYMLLTNMLPNQGNGSFTLHATAFDAEGHATELGARTIVCGNSAATLPFGTIDTPGQGATISGDAYVNFGWALTPLSKTIPFDGSTINVFLDGAPIGTVSYNHPRSDIATLFPGLNNSNGAIGFKEIDTTVLVDGVHTIAWSVSDDAGAAAGIGSRYFLVDNGGSSLTTSRHVDPGPTVAGARARPPLDMSDARASDAGVTFRTGFDLSAARRAASWTGDAWTLRLDPADRLEVFFPPQTRIVNALPVGASFDEAGGILYWQPGPAFLGTHDLAFTDATGVATTVRVNIRPPGVQARIVIDSPATNASGTAFHVAGWTFDPQSHAGPGVSVVHVWAYPASGAPPFFLGAADVMHARPDVAAIYGPLAHDAGYGMTATIVRPGDYLIAVFPFIDAIGTFGPAETVRVTVPHRDR